MLNLKRRYQRITYYFSWRYPRLAAVIQRVSFPVQVFALVAGLYSFVDFYQQHYSFEASMRQHQLRQSTASHAEPETAIPSSVSPNTHASDSLRDRLLLAEQTLRAEILKAEQALIEKQRETHILQVKVLRAKQLLMDEAHTIEHLKLLESQI